jgi:hypothetical protein
MVRPSAGCDKGVANLQICARLVLAKNSDYSRGLSVQFATPRISIQSNTKEEGNLCSEK